MSASPGRRRGIVTSFDDDTGLGVVGDRWGFHCTQIADGTRRVAVGSEVDFELRPAHGGREEAFDLRRPEAGDLRPAPAS